MPVGDAEGVGDAFDGVRTVLLAWFAFTLAVFPLAATVEHAAFHGSLGSLAVLVASVVVTFPAALEVHFSDRDPALVGRFVVAFVVLYVPAIVAQSGVYVALGRTETVPAAEVAVLLATYVAAYGLVYRGGLARLRRAVAR